jgi:hypothetical protein
MKFEIPAAERAKILPKEEIRTRIRALLEQPYITYHLIERLSGLSQHDLERAVLARAPTGRSFTPRMQARLSRFIHQLDRGEWKFSKCKGTRGTDAERVEVPPIVSQPSIQLNINKHGVGITVRPRIIASTSLPNFDKVFPKRES